MYWPTLPNLTHDRNVFCKQCECPRHRKHVSLIPAWRLTDQEEDATRTAHETFLPECCYHCGHMASGIISKLGNWLAKRFPILLIIFEGPFAGAEAYMHVLRLHSGPPGCIQHSTALEKHIELGEQHMKIPLHSGRIRGAFECIRLHSGPPWTHSGAFLRIRLH